MAICTAKERLAVALGWHDARKVLTGTELSRTVSRSSSKSRNLGNLKHEGNETDVGAKRERRFGSFFPLGFLPFQAFSLPRARFSPGSQQLVILAFT